MKANLIFCLALVLGGGLAGCSTANQRATQAIQVGAPLYLYCGLEAYDSAQRCLSTRIYPGDDINVGGDDYLELKGRIEGSGAHFVADLSAGTGQEEQFYQGAITREKPFFAQGAGASGGAGLGWFILTTNRDCLTILKRINATLGLTNAPFNHPAPVFPPSVIAPSPVSTNIPSDIDPNTGLPDGHLFIDPNTGLPLPEPRGGFRTLMEQAALAALPEGMQQTQFAYIGDVQTANNAYHVAEQSLILMDMIAPRGEPTRLLLFSDDARVVAAYELDVSSKEGSPLWCEGARVYLFGSGSYHFVGSLNEIPPDSRLAQLCSGTGAKPTGNVIDFSRGPMNPVLTREKRYGSSGGLKDNPWSSP